MSPAQIIVNILNILNSMEIHLTIMHILPTKLSNQWTCFRIRHLGMCEALGTPGGKVELCLIQNVINIRGAIYQHGLNLIRACISNHSDTVKCGMKLLIHSQTSTVQALGVEVWNWINNFTPHFIKDVITYMSWDYNLNHVGKWAPVECGKQDSLDVFDVSINYILVLWQILVLLRLPNV